MLGFNRKQVPEARSLADEMKDLISLVEKPKHTPDIASLERTAVHALFLYDSLQSKHGKSASLSTIDRLENPAFTEGEFSVWRTKAGPESQVIPLPKTLFNDVDVPWARQKGAPKARIRGELVYVTAPDIVMLDEAKGNMVSFNRMRVTIELPWSERGYDLRKREWDRRLHVNKVRAFMYTGVPGYWGPLIQNSEGNSLFKPVEIHTPNDQRRPRFYFYSVTETNAK